MVQLNQTFSSVIAVAALQIDFSASHGIHNTGCVPIKIAVSHGVCRKIQALG